MKIPTSVLSNQITNTVTHNEHILLTFLVKDKSMEIQRDQCLQGIGSKLIQKNMHIDNALFQHIYCRIISRAEIFKSSLSRKLFSSLHVKVSDEIISYI